MSSGISRVDWLRSSCVTSAAETPKEKPASIEPRHECRGNLLRASLTSQDSEHASIEPRHECRGNRVYRHEGRIGRLASIEPRHECRGNELGDPEVGLRHVASIEPRHECRGNGTIARATSTPGIGFN